MQTLGRGRQTRMKMEKGCLSQNVPETILSFTPKNKKLRFLPNFSLR